MIVNSKSGFTLIELLLAVVITSIIMVGLHQAMGSSLSAYDQNRQKQDLLARASYALERMAKFVRATDSVTEPDTIDDHEILQVSERLLDTYDNTDQTYLDDGDGFLDADNDADNLINEGGGDTADIITFSLDKTDAANWKLIEQMPDYSTPTLGDFAATRVITENVTAFACHLVNTNLVEIELTLAESGETATLKTRALTTHVTSYVGPTGDTAPPTPDPMTWAVLPAATDACHIAMTTSVATDDTTPVEYYFECTAGAGHDSGWQDSTLYTDSGLLASTSFTYRVKARDKSADQNETGWSTAESDTTDPGPVIAFDSVSASTGAWDTGESWSHTVTAGGSDRILLVGVAYAWGDASEGVLSATYGGQSLSQAGMANKDDKAGSEIWYLTDPPTGTNTVVITMKVQVSLICGAISFLNVDQATPFDAFHSATGRSKIPTKIISGVNESEVVVDHVAVEKDKPIDVGAGQTERWNNEVFGEINTLCSTEDGPVGGGDVTMSWTVDDNRDKKWALGAVVLKPVGCQ